MTFVHPETASSHAILRLWCASPQVVATEAQANTCRALLSTDERDRMDRLRFNRNRQEYLAAHALLRIALSYKRSEPADSWEFKQNAYGKPALNPDCGLTFNLSHCSRLAVCLVATLGDVGVDVETHDRAREILEVAGRVFSGLELAQLDALEDSARSGRALSLWTLKEAYCKARGMGFSLPLKGISFLFDDAGAIRMHLDEVLSDQVERWRFCVFDHFGCRVAVMTEQVDTPHLECRELFGLDARPTLMQAPQPRFFPVV